MSGFTLYTTQRLACCRGCDKALPKGTEVVYTYSLRSRGMHIYICKECKELISKMEIT